MRERLLFKVYHFPNVLTFEISILDNSLASFSLRHHATINRCVFTFSLSPTFSTRLVFFSHQLSVFFDSFLSLAGFMIFLYLLSQFFKHYTMTMSSVQLFKFLFVGLFSFSLHQMELKTLLLILVLLIQIILFELLQSI